MKAGLLKPLLRDGRETVEYQVQPGEMMDGQVLKNCKDGKVLGILPMGAAYEDGHNYVYVYTDQKETLADRLKGEITQEQVLRAFESIACTLVNMKEQGVNLAYVVLDSRYIYMDDEVKKARLVCIPGKNASMEEGELPGFFRSILAGAVYLDSEDGDYVAKLLSALNKDFELNSFLLQIRAFMEKKELDIIEEKIPEPVVEPVIPEIPVVESVAAEPVKAEVPSVEPVPVEPMVSEIPSVEPVVAEPLVPEAPSVEPVVAEPLVSEIPNVETIAVEPVVPEVPNVEPVVAEPLVPEVPSVEPIAVEPVAAEVPSVEPIAVEPVMPEVPNVGPAAVQPVAPEALRSVNSVIPEDDIEFEPIPEEISAKIRRMNAQTVEQAPPVPPTHPVMQPMPQSSQVSSVPLVQPVPQDATRLAPEPQKKPSPHLIRVKTGERIPLPEGNFVIGKSQSGVDYTISDNVAISRIHCTIIRENGAYYVRDEKSTNSTFVNGERILPETERLLLNNCKLVLGDEEFIYSLW